MRLVLAAVTPRKQGIRAGAARELFKMYLERLTAYTSAESVFLDSEAALLDAFKRQNGRTAPNLVLLDSRGKPLSSEAFAGRIESVRDSGTQELVFAIGPADGWSAAARTGAAWLLSLGPMTLPHELALVVLAEQLYRAHTILAGHPYHASHTGRYG